MTVMRLGMFGGTFDPPHIGHLVMAEVARETVGLDRVLFIPAAIPPHKAGLSISSGEDRAQMVARAIAPYPAFSLSRCELTRDGVSYTIDTLREVRRQVPYQDAHIYLLLGADMLAQFGAWRESAAIADGATLLAAPREGYELSDLITRTRAQFPNVDIRQLPMPPLDVSATWLRSRIKEGRRVEWLLPAPVLEYVEKRGLYR
ncbi:nicotinate-nucleotide adenylyltransferase [Ferroacidibacillus organovorans]|uniref:Probable nicotinate-nucleotide adenylyltransferase n=3 Tax=Ferroacidibacillus organovorans TaxID=1765683 RepID=A0A1V4EWX6_9BACL|nr:nicotinate-nucleotide adenylyltransferase [Ferroacidibacillus organovorans]OPG17443.1 hypothetical protein B2M26_01550 [Ferroacidibacillus organovorans]